MIALADAIQRNDKSRMEAANAFQQEADRLIDEMRAD
jgi:hypothetical protein